MIVEGIVVGAIMYGKYRWDNRKYYRYRRLIREMPLRKTTFKNSKDENIRFINYKETEYSDRIIVDISKIIGYEELENQKDYLLSYFKAKNIEFKLLENCNIQLDIIRTKASIGNYKVEQQKEHELFVGYNTEGAAIKVNMNSFPHALIGGDSGSGKSRFLLMALTNLIANSDVDLYLMQIRKSDLIVFKDCKQTKYVARSLEDTRDVLKYINDLCIYRDKTIERYTLSKGIYNIEDYNRYFKFSKMKYCYVVLDEFSFFNPNGADNKDIKELKREILGYIKQIVMAGRSSGVFIITSLQKPTNSSIPADIKSQLTSRICFKMNDNETSIIVLGNGDATKIEKRVAIVRGLGQVESNIPYIDHKFIMEAITDKMEQFKKYINIKPKEEVKGKEVTCKNDGVIDLEVLKNVLNK